MKTTGIILLVLGILSTLGGILGTIGGREPNLSGLAFVALGGFLIYRANQKKEEAVVIGTFYPARTSVYFDRKVARNPLLLLHSTVSGNLKRHLITNKQF